MGRHFNPFSIDSDAPEPDDRYILGLAVLTLAGALVLVAWECFLAFRWLFQ